MRSFLFGVGPLGLVGRAGLLVLFPFVVGCGSGRGTVSGQVLYNGAPLPGGRVTFRPSDPKENSVSAELDEQGAYEAMLPAGDVRVSVDNRELAPHDSQPGQLPPGLPPLSPEARKALAAGKPAKAPAQSGENTPKPSPGKYVQIPDKYHKIETSGLRFTVQGGEQKHDIELTK